VSTQARAAPAWTERLADRSPIVRRSIDRSVQQARVLMDAARRVISDKGENFTTQDLVKEAGVALQTFYRSFGGKDELLLAVLEDMIAEACTGFRRRAEAIDDPLERLRAHLGAVFAHLDDVPDRTAEARFIAVEHWRLAATFPDEIARATQPFRDLVRAEIAAAVERGQVRSPDPARDAWLLTQLVISTFHHRSFVATEDPTLVDDLWRFCLRGLGLPAAETRRRGSSATDRIDREERR
jgi:AcrR family transcriptional regulator